jgi:hypothetical protein
LGLAWRGYLALLVLIYYKRKVMPITVVDGICPKMNLRGRIRNYVLEDSKGGAPSR